MFCLDHTHSTNYMMSQVNFHMIMKTSLSNVQIDFIIIVDN